MCRCPNKITYKCRWIYSRLRMKRYCILLVSMCYDWGFFLQFNLCVDLGSLWAGPADKSTPDWPHKWGPAGRLVPGQCIDLGASAWPAVYVPQSPLALQRQGWWQSGGWALPKRNTGYWKMYKNRHIHTHTHYVIQISEIITVFLLCYSERNSGPTLFTTPEWAECTIPCQGSIGRL